MYQGPSTLQPRILVSWILVFISVLETLGLIASPTQRSSGGGGGGSRTSGFGRPTPFPLPVRRRGGG
ncbi:MAG: hypothetical protein HPY50_04520 [Firmicutes bacterium]|nr:hypothetical protein [Bacillota bacterium]